MTDKAAEAPEAPEAPVAETRSTGAKMADEAALIWGSKGSVLDGIKAGAQDMYDHPVHALEAFGAGVAAGVLSSNAYGRAALWGLTALGVTGMLEPDVARVWNDHNALADAQKDLGMKVGETLAYAPVAAAGGLVGARAAQVDWRGVSTRAQVALTGEEPAAVNYTQESAQQFFDKNPSSVVTTQKQHYPVRFDRITAQMYDEEGGLRIQSLETRASGQPGELATEGKWLATRVTASGDTVTEGGNPVQWGIKPDKIIKAYDLEPAQLETANSVTAWTKVAGAPQVPMTPLHSSSTIPAWGTTLATQARPQPVGFMANLSEVVNGQPLGWLSHYGNLDTAIVSPIQFSQTYQVVVPPLWPAMATGTAATASGVGATR